MPTYEINCFFKNKGGVGKTTLACNLVSYLNMHKGKRVLLIDADPQQDTRKKVLAGAMLLEMMNKDPDTQQKMLKQLSTFLTREDDLALFGLKPHA